MWMYINMDYRCVVAVVLLGIVVPVVCQQQQQATQCQRTFLANAMSCVQNASINYVNLQYLNANGTRGQMPQEGIQQFRMRACRVRPQVDQCGQLVFGRLFNSTLCIGGFEEQQLMQTAKDIFGNYDLSCAHPCRYTLLNDLRQCFTLNRMDPQTFIDNAWGQGAVIGTNAQQVNQFCSNRQTLLQCIRQKAQMCPDSNTVFQRLGMDILSMEKGIETLCQYPRVYLGGLRCFSSATPEVKRCIQNGRMKMMSHQSQLRLTLSEHRFKLETCSTKLEQINCELGAWARRQHERCHMAVIGLRNELECKLLPNLCMQLNPHLYQRLCNPMNFHLDQRRNYSSAGTVVITWSTVAILVLVAIFSSA